MQRKVVLITGCSSGIGFHTATHLCDKDYKVYAGLLDPEQNSDRLKNAIINPQGLVPLKLDISSKKIFRRQLNALSIGKVACCF